MPINHILEMRKEAFMQIFANMEWVIRLFFVFDPFEHENEPENKYNHVFRNKLVNKIFDTYASAEQKLEEAQFPNYISFKTEFALYFFYERLKDHNSHRILCSLRLLLIITMRVFRHEVIEEIEKRILNIIEDEAEKAFYVTEFYLFWRTFYQKFNFELPYLEEQKNRIAEIEIESQKS